MSIAQAALTLVISLLVLIVGLAAVKVMERAGWRPVDRLADLVSSERTYTPTPLLAAGEMRGDEIDTDD